MTASFENQPQMIIMMHSQERVSRWIIQIHFNNIFKIMKGKGHGPLKCSSDIFKAEGHIPI